MATIHDLPEAILSNIFAFISDARSRNSAALACRRFRSLERSTRVTIAVRGNARDLHRIPRCFAAAEELDLSLISPWGHALLCPSPRSSIDPALLAHALRVAFPAVKSLAVYVRSAATIRVLAPQWPGLRRVKLVRWHQRSQINAEPGEDFHALFESCPSLAGLDLSEFYYYTEELPPVLEAFPVVAKSLTNLNLMTSFLMEGLKDVEIKAIVESCPNLIDFRVACRFDPRYIGYVGDDVLLAISENCPKLRVLHLADTASFSSSRGGGGPEEDGIGAEDARISRAAMVDFFSGLSFLEELVMEVCQNVKDSGLALEVLATKCRDLRSLRLGQFQGVCSGIVGSRLDGVAVCQGLEALTIGNCFDLNDMGLIEIGRGCFRLKKFHVSGCNGITVKGLRTMICLLWRSLVDVSVSSCKGLNAAATLQAVEPIRGWIRRLHFDCVWGGGGDGGGGGSGGFDLNEVVENEDGYEERSRKRQRCGSESETDDMEEFVGGFSNGFGCSSSWDRLEYLSMWIEVGELLSPLPMAGLEECPNLEHVRVKVEGDCRRRHKPKERAFGLSSLAAYPRLTKMELDCGETIGYALTAPSGQMDLSLWERFFLNGIGILSLNELDYWPPQDRDVNQRSLSLPAAGLLAECLSLRKLFIHGTAHEHFMNFLLRITNLRDVQLRGDYYPAPENDMSTEMRVDSCCRFEDALNARTIED